MTTRFLVLVGGALALLVLPVPIAAAQDAGLVDASDASDASVPALEPPRLLEAPAASYPSDAQGRARVVLELTLDAQGAITASKVIESGGAAFDAAALDAAARLRFEPALRDCEPIAAQIPFSIDFEPPAPPPPPPPPPAAPPPPSQPELIGTTELQVRGAPPPREPTRHSLELEAVRTVPGTGGDVLRAVEIMPGVARPAWGEGQIVVRGSAPEDSLVFVDGTEVPFAYHLGDASSVVPGDLLERLDFYPGNFGPQFGRGMGGVVDVGLRAPRRDRLGALVQIDNVDGRALVEAPLGERTRFLIAGRRSWIDAWIGEVLNDENTTLRAAPVYWDGQAIVEHDLSSATRARLSLFGADDSFRLLVKTPDSRDPAWAGTIGGYSRFLRTQLRVDSDLSERARWQNTLSWGVTDTSQQFGSNFFRFSTHDLALRSDVRVELVESITVVGGIDALWSHNDVRARFQPYPEDGAAQGPYFARPARSAAGSVEQLRPGAYAGLELSPVRALKLMPSVRADYASDTDEVTLDPRFAARWDVLQHGEARTTLKGGLGVFHQPPELEESADIVGTDGVGSNRAVHASLGVEQVFVTGVSLGLEGFYKRFDELIVARGDESRLIGASFENTGDGHAYGGELLGRYERGRLMAMLAYTLSRSERRAREGDEYTLFEHDQTHILSATTSLDLGRRWTLGARFRYVTGRPYTPYLGGLVDLDAGAYAPVQAAPFSARLDAFHQLDLRIEKLWDFEAWKLAAYLELRNAYNHKSVEGVTHNYDYSQQKNVEGLPILPVLGVRGEL